MEGLPQTARNCACLTFQYNFAKHLLHIPLCPTNAIISQSQAYATTIHKYQAIEHFQSINHACILCMHLYRSTILANLYLHR